MQVRVARDEDLDNGLIHFNLGLLERLERNCPSPPGGPQNHQTFEVLVLAGRRDG